MGKGGGALSAWLKEFTALVFTQTIQAFIYAIVISIILFGMVNTTGSITTDDQNAALGLMSTFALLSVFKVEELSKKIFGISDTKASPGNAMRSIAKTAIAAQLGKRVLNNAGKVLGGFRAITQSRKDNMKTEKRLQEDMKDNGYIRDKEGNIRRVAKPSATRPTTSSISSGGSSSSSSGGGGVSSGGSGSVEIPNVPAVKDTSAEDYRRVKAAVRSYEDKMSEIKKARDQGVKDIFSGLTEFTGSMIGGAGGAILGGADGNLDEALQGMMAGAGVGDAIGEATVNAVERATKFVQRRIQHEKGMSHRALKRSIGSYSGAIEKYNMNYGSQNVDDI